MRFVRIKDPEREEYRRAMELYAGSFPLHEQRLPDSQKYILGLEAYHMELVEFEEAFVGAIFFWETDEFVYVEHFCMEPSVRGKGLGRQALAMLAERGKIVILEIDPPVDDISKRRKNFYLRCGFCENPYPHVHPAYREEFQGHELVVMSSPTKVDETSYKEFFAYLQDVVMAV